MKSINDYISKGAIVAIENLIITNGCLIGHKTFSAWGKSLCGAGNVVILQILLDKQNL